MTREAVARIVNTGVDDIKKNWETWEEDLAPKDAPVAPVAGSHRSKRKRAPSPVNPRQKKMAQLGGFFSANLTRKVAQAPAPSQRLSDMPIPGTPPRDGGDWD